MRLTIQVTDTATPFLRAAIARLQRPRPLLEAAGKALANRLKDHFKARQAAGNKHGWPSRRFWYGVGGSVANATALTEVTDRSATVTVADYRFAHKVTGGPIAPKRAAALTIPLTAKAYALGGKGTVRELLPQAFVLRTKKGAYLVTNEQERKGRNVAGMRGKVARIRLQFWFKLVKGVMQAPDPNALPPAAEMEGAVEAAARKVLPQLLK